MSGESKKYPADHSPANPKGRLKTIFHAGTLNARMRQNLAYRLDKETPVMYIIIMADNTNVMKNSNGDFDSS